MCGGFTDKGHIRFSGAPAFRKTLWIFSFLALLLLPLRHVNVGVDLWDGGYNYANFRYNSTEFMDPMWYFATWSANALGSLLMRLPFGNTMLGMNVYTGLIVSILAAVSYFFCVRRLGIPAVVSFLGELAAIALCWAPTAVLYSYLTYLCLLAAVCFLYRGLTSDSVRWLAAAGAALGLSVSVRFSNLVYMGLILAVWLYGFWDRKKPSAVLKDTLFCVLGYGAGLGGFFLVISLRYGAGFYLRSVGRLFQMTEYAADYAPDYMLSGMLRTFLEEENTYWTKRFLVLLVFGTAVCLPFQKIFRAMSAGKKDTAPSAADSPEGFAGLRKGICLALAVCLTVWLRRRGFSYPDYAAYGSIYAPCVVSLELLILLSVWEILKKNAPKRDRLAALLLLMTAFFSSLGGNNGTYASINNMFLVMPGFLWLCLRFVREQKKLWAFPVKCVLGVAVFFVLTSCVGFGRHFVYEEATGGRKMDRTVNGIPVLAGMRTEAGKAEALEGLYRYLTQEDLTDRRCILYGGIPGISYYMEMAPAIHIWSDLTSYGVDVMEEDIAGVDDGIAAGESGPLVILERKYADYLLEGKGDSAVLFPDALGERKLQLIREFMDRHGYDMTYCNEKFALFQINVKNTCIIQKLMLQCKTVFFERRV